VTGCCCSPTASSKPAPQTGSFFGLDRLVDLLTRQEAAGQPPPETLRRLIHTVLDHQHDALQDDATLLLLEWAGEQTATTGGLAQ